MNEFKRNVQVILKNAEEEMFDLNHPYVGTEHLLLSLLKLDSINDITSKYGLTYDVFKDELLSIVGRSSKKSKIVLYTPLMRKVIDNALSISKNRSVDVDEFILFSSILTSDEGIALQILLNLDIDIDSIYNDLYIDKKSEEFGVNLCDVVNTKLIGRDKEINNMIEILLRKKKNNPLLIGVAGVGKSSIVYELARRIKLNLVPNKLLNYKVISLDMSNLLSNTKYRGEFETKLNNIIESVKNKKIILFIDEIHTIVKGGGSESGIDAANILKPYLARDDIKVIGATTIYEYQKYILCDKALSRRFESVLVKEPSIEETKDILLGVKDEYEDYYNIKISESNIDDILELSNKYINNKAFPDKALDLLDNVLSKIYVSNDDCIVNEYLKNNDFYSALNIKLNKRKSILKKDIIDTVSEMTNIRILNNNDYKVISKLIDSKVKDNRLKQLFKSKIENDKVLGLLFRGNNEIIDFAKEIGDYLKYNIIELDMNEFSNRESINRLIGVDIGYVGYNDECLLDKIKYNPYSLLILKNFDNVDSGVYNIFKSILDKGFIKNKKDEVINFNNSLIIMTSNVIKNRIGFNNKLNNNFYITDNVFDFIKIY